MSQNPIPCMVMRGGTSKGVYLLAGDLPGDSAERDRMLLRVMGSPDPRQIDGLGGATSLTSKVAMISASNRPDADVDYQFAQVGGERRGELDGLVGGRIGEAEERGVEGLALHDDFGASVLGTVRIDLAT